MTQFSPDFPSILLLPSPSALPKLPSLFSKCWGKGEWVRKGRKVNTVSITELPSSWDQAWLIASSPRTIFQGATKTMNILELAVQREEEGRIYLLTPIPQWPKVYSREHWLLLIPQLLPHGHWAGLHQQGSPRMEADRHLGSRLCQNALTESQWEPAQSQQQRQNKNAKGRVSQRAPEVMHQRCLIQHPCPLLPTPSLPIDIPTSVSKKHINVVKRERILPPSPNVFLLCLLYLSQ